MRDPDRMPQYDSVSIDVIVDVDAADELDQFARLRALMRSLGINSLAYQMDCYGIISYFRCVIIPCRRAGTASCG